MSDFTSLMLQTAAADSSQPSFKQLPVETRPVFKAQLRLVAHLSLKGTDSPASCATVCYLHVLNNRLYVRLVLKR